LFEKVESLGWVGFTAQDRIDVHAAVVEDGHIAQPRLCSLSGLQQQINKVGLISSAQAGLARVIRGQFDDRLPRITADRRPSTVGYIFAASETLLRVLRREDVEDLLRRFDVDLGFVKN